MVYIAQPHYNIYPLVIFFYISCWELLMDFCWDNIIVYGFILMAIYGIIHYWKKDLSINHKPFYGAITVLIINKIIHWEGFIIKDIALKKHNYIFLKKYFFIKIKNLGPMELLVKKIDNQWIIKQIKPINNFPENIEFLNYLKKIFPYNYGFFLNLIIGDNSYFQKYKFLNQL